jgi:hypothetical protein
VYISPAISGELRIASLMLIMLPANKAGNQRVV